MAATPAAIEDFLSGPLVTWLATCMKKPETLQVYETFFDGAPFIEVLLQIDPEPSQPVPSAANLQGLSITAARIKIFHCIIKNIKSIYEEELGQTIVCLPDCVSLGRAAASEVALEQLQLLLLLLLGCAVQGPTKEHFIARIKELSVDVQHDIVECIKQVTDDQSIVLTLDWTEQPAERLFAHVKRLTGERDKLLQQWVTDICQDTAANCSTVSSAGEGIENNHLAVELADWKARLRKQRQELEEKSEILAECREELEHANSLVSKLKTENTDLIAEARKAKIYRDELDAMRERAERADKLDLEVQRYRERLADAEFYKVRVDELREDNRVLIETREMLENQLARARQRADHVLELEAEIIACKQSVNDVVLERDAAREKIQELIEENLQLEQVTKSALQETSTTTQIIVDSDTEETASGDNSLSEQLTSNAQARALKLELENRRLLSTIDSLKESSFHESSTKILELEKEKKKLTLKCEQLQENCERLNAQNLELENLFKNALQENRKLQDSLDTAKVISDRQSQDLQNERGKISDLMGNVEALSKEKQRVQLLCETVKKRADDAEKSLQQIVEEMQVLQLQADKVEDSEKVSSELSQKVVNFERENANLQREILKVRELMEEKDVVIDQQLEKCCKQEREIARLLKETQSVNVQLEKLQEFEQKTQELLSQVAVYTETITALQNDLVSEKVTNEKFKANLEKLGLNLDVLDNDINIVVEKMLNVPEIAKCFTSIFKGIDGELRNKCVNCAGALEKLESEAFSQAEKVVSSISAEWNEQCEKLCAELSGLQHVNEALQTENARMQVDVATLTSQVSTLTAQQMALQLANSQLVAEKDELAKQQHIQNKQHDTLLLDQVTLRTLHEQLTSEYEDLQKEQEILRKLNRDLRSELRTYKENIATTEKKIAALEQEKEALKNESKSLSNLRTEHSKLKDDFRSLFAASERMKIEYRGLQEEYKKLRVESGRLKLNHTEMQGELSTRSDLVAGLQLENAKLQQKCDMLFEMNTSLDADRRALMDHVSQLLKQYHSLLTHSLEDKQHYHVEEKLFTDKLNNLCRQKEKLEEKIMEHYRKLDNASAKKRGFGATLVRRVRKAGSDIMNKVPSRNRRSWHEDSSRLTQSQFTLGGSGESGGNESDNSTEESLQQRTAVETLRRPVSVAVGSSSFHHAKPKDEVALRKSRDLSAHRSSISGDQIYPREPPTTTNLSLGTAGTRRTVYLSEDEHTPPVPSSNNNPSSTTTTTTNPGKNTPPLLVYNRISTVIGETHKCKTPPQSSNATPVQEGESTEGGGGDRKKGENAKENAIWYEYGCV